MEIVFGKHETPFQVANTIMKSLWWICCPEGPQRPWPGSLLLVVLKVHIRKVGHIAVQASGLMCRALYTECGERTFRCAKADLWLQHFHRLFATRKSESSWFERSKRNWSIWASSQCQQHLILCFSSAPAGVSGRWNSSLRTNFLPSANARTLGPELGDSTSIFKPCKRFTGIGRLSRIQLRPFSCVKSCAASLFQLHSSRLFFQIHYTVSNPRHFPNLPQRRFPSYLTRFNFSLVC